jgi:hypothetical protein
VRVRALLPAAAALAALAGCGTATSSSVDFQGAQKAVADKVGDLASAGRQRKQADICDKLITSRLRAKVAAPRSDCAAEMKKAIEDADGFDLDVRAVTISGNTATARVRSKEQGRYVVRTFKLQRQAGGWRIASFG